jgi:hypothetical protein
MTYGLLLTKKSALRSPGELIYVLCFFASSISNLRIVLAGRAAFVLRKIAGYSFSAAIARFGSQQPFSHGLPGSI